MQILRILEKIGQAVWFLFIVGITLIILFCVIVFAVLVYEDLYTGSCYDSGNVWDYKEDRCRDDCVTFDNDGNCVALTPEEVKKFYESSLTDEEWLEICKRNQKPYNAKTLECDDKWTPKDCFKLEGDWVYPDICNS